MDKQNKKYQRFAVWLSWSRKKRSRGSHELEELTQAIDNFCHFERNKFRERFRLYHRAASKIVGLIKQDLPGLANTLFVDAPDFINARRLIDFAVQGLKRGCPFVPIIWEDYFRRGYGLRVVASELYCSERTAREYVKGFSRRITIQLWEKNLETTGPYPFHPETTQQKKSNDLQGTFRLTDRQAKVLLKFCENKDLGRESIAKALYISENTLKKHITKILKKVGTKTMNEAVEKVTRLGLV